MVGNHMRYRIGDGKRINVWHDKWNSAISLSSIISKKEIFYAGFKDSDNIADMIDEHGWRWPQNWLITYTWLNNIVVPNLRNSPEKPVWIDNDGNEKAFSTSTVWKDVRDNGTKVCWKDLVWHSNCIPKHTFILWLAIKSKMCTQDRLAKWYPNRNFVCSLCNKEADSHDYLFFNCEFASESWKKVCDIEKIGIKKSTWEDTVKAISQEINGKSVWGNIKKISFAAAVYYIWQERNWRLFNNCRRSVEDVFGIPSEELKAKMSSITVKQSASVIKAEQLWNVQFQRKVSKS